MAGLQHQVVNEVTYEGMTLPRNSIAGIPLLPSLKATPEDTIVATYPRSGTTWISEILSMIAFDGDVDAMYAAGTTIHRIPFLEFHRYMTEENYDYVGVEEARKKEGTARIMKTHLPYKYIKRQVEEDGCKLVVVLRNVRDMLVSYYHFYRTLPMFNFKDGSWEDFFQLFTAKRLVYGDWLDHVKSYWELRHRTNVCFVHYEDAVDDLRQTVERLAKFMNKPLPESTVQKIVDSATFKSMKQNARKIMNTSTADSFFREGTYSLWKDYFTAEQDEYVKVNYDKELKTMVLKQKF